MRSDHPGFSLGAAMSAVRAWLLGHPEIGNIRARKIAISGGGHRSTHKQWRRRRADPNYNQARAARRNRR